MIELKIKVEESLVKSIGQAALERQVEDFLRQLILKKAAADILTDLNEDELVNDPKWKVAKESAWESEKYKYFVGNQ